MALKDITIGGNKNAKATEVKIPEKSTMNFARREIGVNYKKLLPVVLIVIIAAVIFAKFGFLDPISEKTRAYSELASKQDQLTAYTAKLQEYDELAKQYGRYSYGWMSESETSIVDRTEVLSLLENKIMRKATVENYAINNNVLTINLTGLSLTQASRVVEDLESSPIVVSATVYNSNSNEDGTEEIYMSIILEKEAEEEK